MSKEALWSMSTTVREAERIIGFTRTAIEIDGKPWNKFTQIEFQIRLIKNREYLNNVDNTQTFNNLNAQQADLLRNKDIEMSYKEAEDIFNAKNYNDPAMRGRQSMAPLVKLGLVFTKFDTKQIVKVSEVGRSLVEGKIDFSDYMLDALLKYQYPNPYDSGFQTWNTKPFINCLRLIKRVNAICRSKNLKEIGISKLEFGIFVLSLKSYTDIDKVANDLLSFRQQYNFRKSDHERDSFSEAFIKSYLKDFNNPVTNVYEYSDNMIRYIRLTRYIYIRGKYSNTYIDLEPRRMTEINSILENDSGKAQQYSQSEWRNYMGRYGTYELPFETVSKLTEILKNIESEVVSLDSELNISYDGIKIPQQVSQLKETIAARRLYRTELQSKKVKESYHSNPNRIDEVIQSLQDIQSYNKRALDKRYSIELEKWTNIALNVINDSILIKSNAPVGDDNEPTYTAPGGVADIECYYQSYNAICEVTMLKSRDQWFNEGQPVMRHLRNMEKKDSSKTCYCIFIAPSIHVDTLNTFFTACKYEFEGVPQHIIPLTISQLGRVIKAVKQSRLNGNTTSHLIFQQLLKKCSDVSCLPNSMKWLSHIETNLNHWVSTIAG